MDKVELRKRDSPRPLFDAHNNNSRGYAILLPQRALGKDPYDNLKMNST
jgi:hypothetical protein